MAVKMPRIIGMPQIGRVVNGLDMKERLLESVMRRLP